MVVTDQEVITGNIKKIEKLENRSEPWQKTETNVEYAGDSLLPICLQPVLTLPRYRMYWKCIQEIKAIKW